MAKKKAKGAWVLKVLALLFVLYISLTIAIGTGYYEAKLSEKTTITNEAMKQFEEDIKSGKKVDIKDYVTDVYKDYSNQTTKAANVFSNIVEGIMTKGIDGMVQIFKTLFS